MLYAAVLYPPVQYQKPEQIDDTAAKAVKGVVKIVPLPAGVGVIAESLHAARKAKDALKVTWSKAPAQTYTNEQILRDYQAIAADWNQPGVEMLNKGDAAAAMNGAAKVIKADFFSEHVSHVCMEPLNATVKVDGDKVETWSGNQSPTTMKILGSIAAGTTPDKVTVHTTYLGGGFGRKTDGDDLFQATLLAKAVSPRPVHMIWSREDDIMNDKFRPLTAQRIEVGLDANNNVVAWRHRIVNESYFARIMPPDLFAKIKQDIVSGGGGEMSYAVPNHRVEWVRAARGVDVGAWRGIAAGYTKFAIETLIDEIAALKRHGPGRLSRSRCSRTTRAPQRWSRRWPRWPTSVASARAGRWGSRTTTRSTATPPRRSKSRSTRRAVRSRSITCGPRSTPASRCSPRTSWRRSRAP